MLTWQEKVKYARKINDLLVGRMENTIFKVHKYSKYTVPNIGLTRVLKILKHKNLQSVLWTYVLCVYTLDVFIQSPVYYQYVGCSFWYRYLNFNEIHTNKKTSVKLYTKSTNSTILIQQNPVSTKMNYHKDCIITLLSYNPVAS